MLSQATAYAASALGWIAAMGGNSVLVKEIAEACEMPAAYLAKIINQLARRKVVLTQRGVVEGLV
jgi:DNA-binding IscR family transcriptional regulator